MLPDDVELMVVDVEDPLEVDGDEVELPPV